MKPLKQFIISILFVNTLSCSFCPAQTVDSAVQIYNQAAILQNQGKYELAEQKYNKVLQLQPEFKEAKHNLALIYYNLAVRYSSAENYTKALPYAQKAVRFNPTDKDSYTLLAEVLTNSKYYKEAAEVYQRLLSQDSTDESVMNNLAQLYVLDNQPAKAAKLYKKMLQINPNNVIVKNNLQYVNRQLEVTALNNSLNNIKDNEKAPEEVYNLIKPAYNVDASIVKKADKMLDLIWSDPTGRILLNFLVEENIPINLAKGTKYDACATTINDSVSILNNESNSIFTKKITLIKIPTCYVNNFYNNNLSVYQRIYGLHAFIHEFCHAYRNVKIPQEHNSLEEEIGASMIGLNIAYKAVTGKYLNLSQTRLYSQECLRALLSDSHKSLPKYSNFIANMQLQGFVMPYPEIYANIENLYEKLAVK